MEVVWARRMLWRRRGAWMWPAFVAATGVDAAVGSLLPLSGEGEAVAAAGLAGLMLNVIGVILLSRPLGALVRRARPDMPRVVARDYGGTLVVCGVSALLLAGGLVHHHLIVRDRNAMRDATVRAQAYIGDRAPAEFRRNLQAVNTFAIQSPTLYRVCVPGQRSGRTYCVIVDEHVSFERSVRFGGYEPNWLFSEGVG